MGDLGKVAYDLTEGYNRQRKILTPLSLLRLPPLMSSPPTIGAPTASKSIPSITTSSYDVMINNRTAFNSVFTFPGVHVLRADWNGTTYAETGDRNLVKGSNTAPYSTPGHIAVEFTFYGLEFEIYERPMAAVKVYQILVDEGLGYQRVFDTPQVAAASGQPYQYRKVTFAAKKMRRIRLEYDGCYFGGVFAHPNDTVFPSISQKRPRFVGFGDSNVAGAMADSIWTGFIPMLGHMLGWDTYISGIGSTGYANIGTGTIQKTYGQRIDVDCIDLKPDVVLIVGGNNDITQPIETVQAESLALYRKLKEKLPNAEIIVHGNMAKKVPIAAEQGAVCDILRANALSVGLPFIDTINGVTYDKKGNAINSPRGNWFSGNGTVAAPTSTGNSSVFLSSDGAHCSQDGYNYLADLTAYEMLRLLS